MTVSNRGRWGRRIPTAAGLITVHQALAASFYALGGWVVHLAVAAGPKFHLWMIPWFFTDYWLFWGAWPSEGYFVPIAPGSNVLAALMIAAAGLTVRRGGDDGE